MAKFAVRAVVILLGAVAAYWVAFGVATWRGAQPVQADGWGWIAATAVFVLLFMGSDSGLVRFRGLRERIYAGREGGWDGRPEKGTSARDVPGEPGGRSAEAIGDQPHARPSRDAQ